MDSIRIIQLPTKSAAGTDDYIAVDSTANGTKKIQFPNLLDNGLTIQNKAADAKATGDAISEVSGAIGNEASTRQSADVNLQTQIDQLIAPSGEAPSAAEVENARIGVPPENTVYPTLGDAIRGQVTDLKSDINEYASAYSITETSGYFGTTGEIIEATSDAEVYTNRLSVTEGESVKWSQTFSEKKRIWVAYIFYNSGGGRVGYRTNLIALGSATQSEAHGFLQIPSGVSYVAFTYRTFGESNTFKAQRFINTDTIETMRNDIPKWFDIPLSDNYRDGWIKYSDGSFTGSTATKTYIYNNVGMSKIRAYLLSGGTTIAAVAFYSGATISTDTYMGSASVPWEYYTYAWYEVDIPTNCKLIAVITNNATETFTPRVQYQVSEINAFVNGSTERAINIAEGYSFPFAFDKFYYHMLTEQVTNDFTSEIIIPAQSIFDVQLASRLGFKYIEANVHATATSGKYVVTHGNGGKLGNDFETLSGQQVNNVVIASTAFDTLRSNYRYRSKYPKYRVPITSLEEFLLECRSCNIYPVLQYVDETAIGIARGIIGDNMILYNGSRAIFDGYIMEVGDSATAESIVARANMYGKPFMYCILNPTSLTDAQLKAVVEGVHNAGYFIGYAGNYFDLSNNIRLLNAGFDFTSSANMVNDFDNGNIVDFADDISFEDISTNGTISDGALSLTHGQTVTIANADESFLKKYLLSIRYDGTLNMHIPKIAPSGYTDVECTSDGKQVVKFGGTIIDDTTNIVLTADGAVTIYSVGFKLSTC